MTKYKIIIEEIFPHISLESLFSNRECILGISMSNPVYWRSSLKDILKWTSDSFDTIYLVVGDFLNRFNEEILNQQNVPNAEKNAIKTGDEFIKHLEKYLREYPKEKFKVIRWVDLLKVRQNQEEIKKIYNLYSSNKFFKMMINESATEYLDFQKKRGKSINVPDDKAISLSASYLLEELAIFNNMISEGIKVIVYPGAQLSILTSMATGEFSGISDHLKDGIYVQLKVTKKS